MFDVIGVEEAYGDSLFERQPDTVPAGESLVWAMASESGGFKLRYPAEDGVYEKDSVDAAIGESR